MLRGPHLAPLALLVAACGGGGGGAPTVQPSTSLRLTADAAEIGSTATTGEVLVRLADVAAVPTALLQVAVELPAALVLPPTDRLVASAPLPNLDGDVVGNRFVVLCGDAQNTAAAALQPGPLFRLRVAPASPRQPGTYTVRFVEARAAGRGGEVVDVDAAPVTATVVVR